MTALRQRSDRGWQWRKDGRPPDDDENAYRWDRRLGRWIAIDDDEPELDEAAFEDWEERRPERIAERNERYEDDEAEDATKKWRASRVRTFCNGALSASEVSGAQASISDHLPPRSARRARTPAEPKPRPTAPEIDDEPPDIRETIRKALAPSLSWIIYPQSDGGFIVMSNVPDGDGFLAFLITPCEVADGLAAGLAGGRSARIAYLAEANLRISGNKKPI